MEDWLHLIMEQGYADVDELELQEHFNFVPEEHLQYSAHLFPLYLRLVLHSSEILVILYFFEETKDFIFQ